MAILVHAETRDKISDIYNNLKLVSEDRLEQKHTDTHTGGNTYRFNKMINNKKNYLNIKQM